MPQDREMPCAVSALHLWPVIVCLQEMMMVMEQMDRDLYAALGDSRQQKMLRWENR